MEDINFILKCFKNGLLNDTGKREIINYISSLEKKNEKLENTILYLEDIIKKLSAYIEDKKC